MTLVRTLIALTLAAQLSACGIMTTTPKPPPPPTAQAQGDRPRADRRAGEDRYRHRRGAQPDGRGSGDPSSKATAAGARYYVIIMNSETIVPGQWYSLCDSVSVRRGFFKQIYTGFAQAEVGCCTLSDSMPHVADAIQDLTKGNAMKRSTALTSSCFSRGCSAPAHSPPSWRPPIA